MKNFFNTEKLNLDKNSRAHRLLADAKNWLPALLSVACLYGLFFLLHLPCPIKFVTGISCAGCGMTRAWLALLRLDVAAAFHFHPLFWLPPLGILTILFKNRLSHKIYTIITFTIITLFVIIYVYRLFGNDSIVTFRLADGIIFRLLNKFLR